MTKSDIDAEFVLDYLNNGLLDLTPPKDGVYNVSFPVQFKNEEPVVIGGLFRFKDNKWSIVKPSHKEDSND